MRYSDVTSLMARLVPPRREFILRSAGHVRYVGVGRFGQVSVLVVAGLFVGWVGFTSASYVSNALAVAERNVRIATSDRIIRSMQDEIDDLKEDLEKSDREAKKQAATNRKVASRNTSLSKQIKDLEAERDRLIAARETRDRNIARLNDQLNQSNSGRDDLSRQLGDAEVQFGKSRAEREELLAQAKAAADEITRLKGEIGQLSEKQAGLTGELQAAQEKLNATDQARADALAERDQMNQQVARLSDRLELFAATQTESIDRLGESADRGIDALERTLELSGLDIPLMLERVLGDQADIRGGVGGPLLAVDNEPGSETGEKLADVEQRLLRLQGLQNLMEHLPFALPLNEFRVTSSFGRRRDPFTGQLAMHPGVDFASRSRNPVHVTAAGTVAFVGWKGGYGKVVEVDHGLGIRTRFAHLSRIYVKRGQKLEFREKVGLVGSTGRSTAPHLHYEVMVDGQSLDPANFMRAGQYVFKN